MSQKCDQNRKICVSYDNTFFFALTAAVLLTDLTTGFEAVTAGFLS